SSVKLLDVGRSTLKLHTGRTLDWNCSTGRASLLNLTARTLTVKRSTDALCKTLDFGRLDVKLLAFDHRRETALLSCAQSVKLPTGRSTVKLLYWTPSVKLLDWSDLDCETARRVGLSTVKPLNWTNLDCNARLTLAVKLLDWSDSRLSTVKLLDCELLD
ncbi:hypothetical protein L9F63_014551, partial [Diploptera punctata]